MLESADVKEGELKGRQKARQKQSHNWHIFSYWQQKTSEDFKQG